MRLEIVVENSYRERCPADAVRLFAEIFRGSSFFNSLIYILKTLLSL